MTYLFNFGVPTVYSVLLVAIFTFLLIRGITHLFVGLFMAASILHLAQTLGYAFMNRLPGGFGAHQQYLPILAIVGLVGTGLSLIAFIALAAFLLREEERPSA